MDAVKSKVNNINRQIKHRNEPVYKSSNFIKKNNKSHTTGNRLQIQLEPSKASQAKKVLMDHIIGGTKTALARRQNQSMNEKPI